MQTTVEYHTAFTVLQKTVPWQYFVVGPVIIFAIITVAVAVAIIRSIQRRARLFPALAYLVLLLFSAYFLYSIGRSGMRDKMYDSAKKAYAEGRYSVVEGTVTNFRPMPYTGHQEETFSVNGVQFSYSDFILAPCFNNTASHGGPIREGLRVRIAYSDNCILKLEVATHP